MRILKLNVHDFRLTNMLSLKIEIKVKNLTHSEFKILNNHIDIIISMLTFSRLLVIFCKL